MILVCTHIRRWLTQTKIWRIVGFVSAVVGLLCYALSSSFNLLFGDWNFSKIFLYCVFSFIICFITLFAKVWQFSIGAAFSYSLIIFSSSLDATPQSGFSEDHIVIQVQHSQVDSQNVNIDSNNDSVIHVDSQDIDIDSSIEVDSHHMNTDSNIKKDLLQLDAALIISQFKACISALKRKDPIILHSVEKYVGVYNFPNNHVEKYFEVSNIHLATDDNLLIDSLPPENINSLHETVKKMMAAGFEKECCHMYISCRKKFLQKCLRRLQLSKFNSQESLTVVTHKWMIASIVALRILFPSERRLCDRIFFGFSSAANLSFMEVCRELTNHLLSLPNNLATESRCFSYLGSSLEVFRALGDLTPEFESVFFDQCSVSLKNEAITIQKRLGEAIIVLFMELENDIHPDTSQKVVTEDGIDPTITYMVERCFRVFLEDRGGTLKKIFKEFPMVGDREGTYILDWIRGLLESNVEAKSKNYTDTAFAQVSTMNNHNYIVQNAIYPGLGEFNISSNEWKQILRGYNTNIQQNLEQYQRTWDKLLDLLKLDSNESVMPNVAAESMKEKLKLFNKQFKETCKVQSTWYVPKKLLREKIRISIEKILLPAYGNFIARFQNILGKDAYEYIEYGMFDIEALLNTLFQGNKKGSTKMLTAPIS
ncbi:putative exocyst complex component Exo70, cullin repeat-like-containing domain-containing protein [Lupinus albus]|uniref:Exocyst subunit Exo70 family protein n=1 Tax=Lupinus albus TaxID=3870 RepID=A0A6A4P6L1_LUPAL|nr:putative exocyst complex component Exo70, cullin repeat-like-containing domain-containing protein [Lupinus albus]